VTRTSAAVLRSQEELAQTEEEPPGEATASQEEEPPGSVIAAHKTRFFSYIPDESWNDWKWHFRNRITTIEELAKFIPL